jgi:hypothetical protein
VRFETWLTKDRPSIKHSNLVKSRLIEVPIPANEKNIEILGANLEGAFLKKLGFFQLTSTLFCGSEVKRGFAGRPLKNRSFEVNYLVEGGDQPIFLQCNFAGPVPTYFFYEKNVLDDLSGPQVEVVLDDLVELVRRLVGGAVVENGDRNGLGDADGIRHLKTGFAKMSHFTSLPPPNFADAPLSGEK